MVQFHSKLYTGEACNSASIIIKIENGYKYVFQVVNILTVVWKKNSKF